MCDWVIELHDEFNRDSLMAHEVDYRNHIVKLLQNERLALLNQKFGPDIARLICGATDKAFLNTNNDQETFLAIANPISLHEDYFVTPLEKQVVDVHVYWIQCWIDGSVAKVNRRITFQVARENYVENIERLLRAPDLLKESDHHLADGHFRNLLEDLHELYEVYEISSNLTHLEAFYISKEDEFTETLIRKCNCLWQVDGTFHHIRRCDTMFAELTGILVDAIPGFTVYEETYNSYSDYSYHNPSRSCPGCAWDDEDGPDPEDPYSQGAWECEGGVYYRVEPREVCCSCIYISPPARKVCFV